MTIAHSQETLVQDLRGLGIEAGTTIFIHSSFKSLGPVTGGAGTVISAFKDVVGSEGLILIPSFNLVEKRAETWDIEITPSTVGWLTEFFRQMDGTFRSDHYSHSVASSGKKASDFVADHLSQKGYQSPWDLQPWGRTYGSQSPMYRAYQQDGKLLMLGVDYQSSTYIHLVEVIYWNQRRGANPDAPYVALDRLSLGQFWDESGKLTRGRVGNANCRFFNIRNYVDSLLEEVKSNLFPYV